MTDPLFAGAVIPFSTLTPAACSIIAERLGNAMDHLAAWGMDRKVMTRLGLARVQLVAVAQTDSYGQTTEELRDTARALQVATDFFQIAGVIHGEQVSAIKEELLLAVNGNLVGTKGSRKPCEFQSQYWFGMLLARAGLRPRVPPPQASTSRPDFVVSVDTLDVAVEVKRPERLRSARDALDRAAGQLRDFGLPGVLVLDLSDCFGSDALTTVAIDHPLSLRATVEPHFRERAVWLSERPIRYNQSDKYKRVLAVVSFIRLVGWRRPDMSQPESVILVQSTGYPGACNGLVDAQADRLRERIRDGFAEVTGRRVD